MMLVKRLVFESEKTLFTDPHTNKPVFYYT